MRTLLAAPEPEPWPLVASTFTTSVGGMASTVTVTTWFLPAPCATPPPFRTSAYVGEPVREIEQ